MKSRIWALIQDRYTPSTRHTGNILWNFASGASVIDEPSIVDGVFYWGSDYRNIAGTGNDNVYDSAWPTRAIKASVRTDQGSESGSLHSNRRLRQESSVLL